MDAPRPPPCARLLLGSLVLASCVIASFLITVCLACDARADEPVRVALTDEEQAWLDAHPVITFGPDPSWPPYESFDADGVFQGISADHMRLVAKRLGVRFEFVQKPTWADVVTAVKAREIDCYSTAVATEDRRAYMSFTRPHVTQPGIILSREDAPAYATLQALRGKKVCIVSGYWWEEELRRKHPSILRVTAPDIATGLGMLSFGSVDAMVNDPATSSWYIHELGITNVRIAARIPGKTELAVGVRKDWPLLRNAIDKALATITPAEFRTIERRWIAFELGEESEFPWLLAVGIVALLLLIAGLGLGANRMLKNRIAQQTEQLRGELERREDVSRAVGRATIEVTGAATQLAASARAQSETAAASQASSAQATAAVRGITSTVERLLEAVEAVYGVAQRTAERAESGREQLERLDVVMRVMAEANKNMGERVVALKESAGGIRLATVMMVRVVDQTSLLSVNSAIEAEKAGEYGRGFKVVAQEIQRLADQSAEATMQIEEIVSEIRRGIAAGVHEASETRVRVEGGVEQAGHIGTELGAILQEIGKLSASFEEIRELVLDQSASSETIETSLREVEQGAQASSASSAQLADVSQTLQDAVDGLREDVSALEMD